MKYQLRIGVPGTTTDTHNTYEAGWSYSYGSSASLSGSNYYKLSNSSSRFANPGGGWFRHNYNI